MEIEFVGAGAGIEAQSNGTMTGLGTNPHLHGNSVVTQGAPHTGGERCIHKKKVLPGAEWKTGACGFKTRL